MIACTDPNTDIGDVIVDGKFGWWCESNDSNAFRSIIIDIINNPNSRSKETEFDILNNLYSCQNSYNIIVKGMGAR